MPLESPTRFANVPNVIPAFDCREKARAAPHGYGPAIAGDPVAAEQLASITQRVINEAY
jgi:hypothetical protein